MCISFIQSCFSIISNRCIGLAYNLTVMSTYQTPCCVMAVHLTLVQNKILVNILQFVGLKISSLILIKFHSYNIFVFHSLW